MIGNFLQVWVNLADLVEFQVRSYSVNANHNMTAATRCVVDVLDELEQYTGIKYAMDKSGINICP